MRTARGRSGALALLLVTCGLTAGAGNAAAAQVGQSEGSPTFQSCFGTNQLDIQTSTASGTSYVVPANGNLTSFSSRMYADGSLTPVTLRLVVLRADPQTLGTYTVVGLSSESYVLPTSLPLTAVTTAITPIAVQAGDVLGASWAGKSGVGSFVGCGAPGVVGDNVGLEVATPVVGNSFSGFGAFAKSLLSISANFEPSSQPTQLVAAHLARATSYRLRATLTSSGSPLAHQSIVFTTGSGMNLRNLCTAVTSAKGVATCTVSAKAAVTAITSNGSYTARFAQTGSYDASSGSASVGKGK
jgi:hypothetical protein